MRRFESSRGRQRFERAEARAGTALEILCPPLTAFDTVCCVTEVSTAQPARRPHPTIEDVAAHAGVSVATVSRALRGLPNVAAATRRRIEQAAVELHYHPDPAAARLAAGQTKTLTLGVPHLNSWYYSNVVAGAERVARESGYEVHVICIGNDAAVARTFAPAARLERRTDAILLVDIDIDGPTADSLRERGVVVGTIGFHTPGHPAIQIDDRLVGRIAGNHLVSIGCTRMGMIVGHPDDPMRLRVPELRRAGFDEALAARGHDVGRRIGTAEFGVEGGRHAMAELLRLPADERPDGVFAFADELAFGALMELRSQRVPIGVGEGAVAVIGVDDHEFAPVVELTTVHQPVNEHGATLARQLIQEILSEQTELDHLPVGDDAGDAATDLATELTRPGIFLVERGSTAPVRVS